MSKKSKEEKIKNLEEKSKEKEVKESKNNKKRNIILIVAGLLLLIVALFLFWFFNRKFKVIFDYNNGTKEETILVKYNKTIEKEDIKTKEDLGDKFIDWYLVLEEKDGEDVLADKPYDFKTKITKETKLKAVYDGKVETITITFDSKGGSSVDAITINKGAELTLPKDPTYEGYTFKGWVDKNDTPIYDKVKLAEDTTLYATWEKVEEEKDEPKQEQPKPEVKKEEKISLSLSNYYMHRDGIKTSRATASTENASGNVTYSLSSSICARINSSTGAITAVPYSELDSMGEQVCEVGQTVTVTATLPSGKSASQTLVLEKDLNATVGNKSFYSGDRDKGFEHNRDGSFTITTNMDVNWSVSGAVSGSTSAYGSSYSGKMINQGNGNAFFTITSKGGQRIELFCQYYGN